MGVCRGVVWRGVAWRGVAWRGAAWRGVEGCGVAWLGIMWREMQLRFVSQRQCGPFTDNKLPISCSFSRNKPLWRPKGGKVGKLSDGGRGFESEKNVKIEKECKQMTEISKKKVEINREIEQFKSKGSG